MNSTLSYYFGANSALTSPSNAFERALITGAASHGLKLSKTTGYQRGDLSHDSAIPVYRLSNPEGSYIEFFAQKKSVNVLMFFVCLEQQNKFYPAKKLSQAFLKIIFGAGASNVIGDASGNHKPVKGREWRDVRYNAQCTRLQRFYELLGMSSIGGKVMIIPALPPPQKLPLFQVQQA